MTTPANPYAEAFGDLLADADRNIPATGDAIVDGFLVAIEEWITYHAGQQVEYERLRERVRKALSM